MADIKKLHPLEENHRDFDAVIGNSIMAGKLALVESFDKGPRTYVIYDRHEPMDSSYAVRMGGSIDEIRDDETAKLLIIRGIETNFQ